ncbi:small acid-soluble spore protein SspI [Aureibacillus halotolerans]|uniref:Small, acid-soluble spore protein I n=1 Tax=Aureibacillus halotolerans TaxID=1508390 RepID=A0A4R6TYX6_9BACI|nr:small acid-soluble spore protein SspI [Aureibacillus halotolerans]TDQ39168.1 small acid-soluble spore protein I (minor) [Aureibacillus halotolerans]
MDLNLRKAITQNVQSNSRDELENTIVDAIQSGEEKMLPGLGVLFEIIWQHADQEEQEEMLTMLHDGLHTN